MKNRRVRTFPYPCHNANSTLPTFVAFSLLSLAPARAANIYWDGVNNSSWATAGSWSTVSGATTPDPALPPGSGDIAIFNISTVAAGVTALLSGNQSAQGLQFVHTSGTAAIRASVAGQTLSLGASGLNWGNTQVDLGGGGTAAMLVSLTASQSWTSSGSGFFQVNTSSTITTPAITNGSASAVTLTFAGLSTGSKNISGEISDGAAVGAITAINLATTGTFGALGLIGTNTYSGGTTFTSGFLNLQNNSALGTGALTIVNNALTHQITSGLVGGVTMINNNAINLNATTLLGGSQNINFGTGTVSLQSASILSLNSSSNSTVFTFGGNLTGGNTLAINNAGGALTNSLVNFNGTGTPGVISVNGGAVSFGSSASVPSGTGTVVLNGGAIAVGSGAFTTLASLSGDTRVTKSTGAFALTGDSNENFTPPNTVISLGAAVGSVVKYTGVLTRNGANYNVGGGGGTIVFSNANAFTGTSSVVANPSGGGGTVIITGQNNYTGLTTLPAGTLEVSSINSVIGGTTTSNLGAPTTAANGQITFASSGAAFLRYTGSGETTDRNIIYNQGFPNSMGLDASGSGTVAFTGTFTQANTGVQNRTVVLRGVNTGSNSFAGNLTNGGFGTLAIAKQQRGSWTVTGANSITNGITVNGGTLTADYASNGTVLGGASNLTLGGGTLAMVGAPAGGTAQTLGNTVLSANTGQSNIGVTGNGTAGSAVLTLGNTFTRNANTFLNFNLANGGQIVTASTQLTNSVLVGSGGANAAYTVTSAGSTDFATVSGGQIAKLGAPTGALLATGNAATGNYLLSGDLTLTSAASINTLRIDTSAATGALTLGANSITAGLGSIMKDGANDYNIAGTRLAQGGGTIALAVYGSGALNVASAVTDGGGSFIKTGSGLVNVTGVQAYTGSTAILGGVVRLANATFGISNITLNTGGILEIGADLNAAAAGDFSRQVGTNASQVQWLNGDGGFSAFTAVAGGTRTVSLTNALSVSNGQLVWGSTSGNNFVTSPNASPAFVKDGFALLLSTSTSNATLDFTNPIDLVNARRAVVVGDGTAATDAVLSGVLSSSDFSGGIDKSGAGTLALTASNTYTGQTTVSAGRLLANNAIGSATGSGMVSVASTGTLGGTGTISGDISVSGVLSPGASIESLGAGSLSLLNGSTFQYELQDNTGAGADLAYSAGNLSLTGTITLDLIKIGGFAWNGGDKLTLISYAGMLAANSLFSFSDGNDGLLADDETFSFDGVSWTIDYNDTLKGSNFASEASGNYVTMTVIPEPAASLLGGLGALTLLRRRRTDVSPS